MWCLSYPILAAYAAGFVLTLLLARYLTPPRWWRQANARALLILAGGTWAFGALLGLAVPLLAPGASGACLVRHRGTVPQAGLAARAAAPGFPDGAPPAPVAPRGPARASLPRPPAAGTSYTVAQPLNLRAAPGVSANRIATVPAHSALIATGVVAGDWWQVRQRTGTTASTGWANSLWLRRGEELPPGP